MKLHLQDLPSVDSSGYITLYNHSHKDRNLWILIGPKMPWLPNPWGFPPAPAEAPELGLPEGFDLEKSRRRVQGMMRTKQGEIRDGNNSCPILADDSWRLWRPRSLTTPDDSWRPLTTPDDPWRPLTTPDDPWRPLTTPDDPWRPLTTPDDPWRPLTTPDDPWRPLTTPDDPWRPLTTPDDPWRPLTTPDDSWRPLTTPDDPWRPLTTPDDPWPTATGDLCPFWRPCLWPLFVCWTYWFVGWMGGKFQQFTPHILLSVLLCEVEGVKSC